MSDGVAHRFQCRVYYEDTDLGGIVYHANYLKFIERARSDWVREMGLDQRRMRDEGLIFVVRRIEADFVAPAGLDDVLDVTTRVDELAGASTTLLQQVHRDGALLFAARVQLVCAAVSGGARRLPAEFRRAAAAATK